MTEKVLLTGATGFLGSHVARAAIEKGVRLTAMARQPRGASNLAGLDLPILEADLTKPESLLKATEGIDTVIHLAAYYTFHGKPALYEKINVEGTRHLLDACVKNAVRKIIYCSSTEAIGPVPNPPGDEESAPDPQYEYGRSKLKAEAIVREYGAEGLDYTILRPSGLYGPGNIDDVAFWFITSFANKALPTRFIVGSGKRLVQFTHVKDAARAFIQVLSRPEVSSQQTYIIADSRCCSYAEVYGMLAEICGRSVPSLHVPPYLAKVMIAPVEAFNKITGRESFMWHTSTVDSVTNDRCYSSAKAEHDLGFVASYGLRAGLLETVEWYKANGYI